MLIVQMEPPQNTDGGDYFYRTYAPGVAMAEEEGIYVVNLTNLHRKRWEVLGAADVLVLKNVCDPDLLPLIAARKWAGKVTVYELADDLSAVEPWNPMHFFYKDRENLGLICRLISFCDAFQVSVPELRRLYGGLNPRHAVFANQVLDPPFAPRFHRAGDIVVGWGGSHGHLQDMAKIAKPLTEWLTSRPGVKLSLMCSDPIWNLFRDVPDARKTRAYPGSIDEYQTFLNEIDLGIAPLQNTPFNRCRSDIKFLEYAVFGVVPVVQELEPYIHSVEREKTGFLFKDVSELIRILDDISADREKIHRVAEAAHAYVLEHRLQRQHTSERLEFYSSLLGATVRRSEETNCLDQFITWSEMEGAKRRGRHLHLECTQYELLLHDGLILMEVEKEWDKARALFGAADKIARDDHLPSLLMACVSNHPMGALQKAVQMNSQSIRSWVLMGETFAQTGRIREALSCYDSAVALCPEYDVPYVRAADVLDQLGEAREAERLRLKAQNLQARFCIPEPVNTGHSRYNPEAVNSPRCRLDTSCVRA